MVLQEIISELRSAEKPVGKVLSKGEDFHVLAIGFNKDMILPEHKSNLRARLVVIKGEVIYHCDSGATSLALYDEYEIPVDEPHWVKANEDSLILVIKG